MTYAKVTVSSLDETRSLTDSFLVDTGATDSVMPLEKIKELGIILEGSMRYEVADGRKVAFDF